MFHTFHEFMLHTKGWAYILMGFILVAMAVYWPFILDREDDPFKKWKDKLEAHKKH